MKIPVIAAFKKLIDTFPAGRRKQNGVQPEEESEENQGRDDYIVSAGDRRAVEMSRNGIFACPRFDKFFCEEDDVRIN